MYVKAINNPHSLCIIILVLCSQIYSCDQLFGQNKETLKREESGKRKSDLYLRAPYVVPGTLPEMRKVSYWVSQMQHPDDIVLNPEEIEQRNKAYEKYLSQSQFDSALTQQINKQLKDRPGLLLDVPVLNTMTSSELAALVKSLIESETAYLKSRNFGNIMSIEYSVAELQAIEEEIIFELERAQKAPRSAITIQQCQLKLIPSIKPEYIGLFTNGKARWDLWNLDVLPIATPVQVLYSSKSSAFLFVLTARGYGWVAADKIAFGSIADINSYTTTTEFIICTGDRVPFYADSNCTVFWGWMQMGDRLPLWSNNSPSVQIPCRTTTGELVFETGWLRPDADIHMGYLPYTRRHVVEQAFKLLDNLYDWTGAWYGRNHVTNLRDIFSCFGFRLPANGTLLSAYGQRSRMVYAKEGREAQLKAIFSSEPFLTLQICENSHSQMYLGNLQGMPIVCDAHGYGYEDGQGNDLELKRWVVGTLEMPDYFLKQDITFVDLY